MFNLEFIQISATTRGGEAQFLSAVIASTGLILTIFGCIKSAPYAVGLYITAAYWFTASTSFANPAVTIARSITNTFSGISPNDVIAFIIAQLAETLIGFALVKLLWASDDEKQKSV